MRIVPASLVFVAFCAAAAGCFHSECPQAHLANRELRDSSRLAQRRDCGCPTSDAVPEQDSSLGDAQTAPHATQILPKCGTTISMQVRRPVLVVRHRVSDGSISDAWCETGFGVRDGPYVQWWNKDLRSEVGTYKNGKKHGKWISFHTDGKIASEGHYDETGKRDGLWRWWWSYEVDESGKPLLQDVGNFLHGRAVGRWKSWDRHGNLIRKTTNAFIIGSVSGRIELYVNGGEPELFQAALNVLRRLTPEQRKSVASDPKFEAALEEMRATDGAGIEPEEISALRRALKYRE